MVFVNRLGELAAATETGIYAWALMTNHAHILLRSSEIGLSGFMRRLLTGNDIYYNRRHRRWGHLLQKYAKMRKFQLKKSKRGQPPQEGEQGAGPNCDWAVKDTRVSSS